MKPEIELYLAKSREALTDARDFLSIKKANAAGRSAYLAGFHAAQALILAHTGKIAKTHTGVQSQFYKLTLHETKVDAKLKRFLTSTYNLKAVADYEVGPQATISPDVAQQTIDWADHFIKVVLELINETDQ